MYCPKCGKENECPCLACIGRTLGQVVWRRQDGVEACGHCGFAMHADHWTELDMQACYGVENVTPERVKQVFEAGDYPEVDIDKYLASKYDKTGMPVKAKESST